MSSHGTTSTHSTKHLLTSWFDLKFRLIVQAILVGLFSGSVVVLYRYLIEHAFDSTMSFYPYLVKHLWLIPIWLVVLGGGGYITGLIVKKQPMISGSGIPQVKGFLQSRVDMVWWKAILGKIVGGILSIGAGLSLGREGPSIQIGASVGQGFSRLFRKAKIEENFLVTCGASAGLAAAFNAPIAGVIFALEELHGNFSTLVMVSALASSLVADFVSKEFLDSSLFLISAVLLPSL
ncbi:chloride channel protein [Paenibacillus hexagrammi]|uniref:Chloride channel protein n=1 Tax=Paenibacillus hexagrammi TaxID=2908839 RepID=A0ABY3SN29_9BACL|nr:chloride channel protein [Paenibacillus sp. YPD9-1]UJF34830.1 chloride channel protein [Paenibacillus sp. YPD9-1]